jgi:hypothetical protein
MEDESLEYYANKINESSDRLLRLCNVDAPKLIIEMERSLLLSKIMHFPVDREAYLSNKEIKNNIVIKEQEHLAKTGYYDDIEKFIDEA